MISLGLPYVRGYKPRANVQGALSDEIQRRLEEDPGLFAALHAAPQESRRRAAASRPGKLARGLTALAFEGLSPRS